MDGDDNALGDVFVKNVLTGEITCVSTDAEGHFVDGRATDSAISADGRYVVFRSDGALLHDGQDGVGSGNQPGAWGLEPASGVFCTRRTSRSSASTEAASGSASGSGAAGRQR